MEKLYDERDVIILDKEGLYDKGDVAAELAYRDMIIDKLKDEINTLQGD